VIKGSTTAFIALLDRMVAKDKIAIARLTPRVNSPPRFVALLPQSEIYDEDNVQLEPAGFYLIYLPYADDIRAVKLQPAPKANEEQIKKAKKIVKALRIKFDSRNFENPAIQKHYSNLQALALDRETQEDTPDYVMPDEEGMSKFSDTISEFKADILGNNYDPKKKIKRTIQ